LETTGVVASSDDALGASLVIRGLDIKQDKEVTSALDRLNGSWETPAGDEIGDTLEFARKLREILQGFYYVWEWPNGNINYDWLKARKEWKKFVRNMIQTNRKQMDSELAVWNYCTNEQEYTNWRAWRSYPQPPTTPVWLSKFLASVAGSWLYDNEGIIWVAHDAVGQMLAEETGLRYFGGGQRNNAEILSWDKSFIASILAHSTGKNLQRWNRNLLIDTPSSGAAFEQLLGRTHRPGQKADEVIFDVALLGEAVRGFVDSAVLDAHYIEDTTGARQKLLYGRILLPEMGSGKTKKNRNKPKT